MGDFPNVAVKPCATREAAIEPESVLQEFLAMPQGEVFLDAQLIEWLKLAGRQRGKAPLLTAIMICEQSIQLGRYEHLLLTPDMIGRHEMNRVTVYRALVDLERAGLVSVRRRRGSSPLISIVADHLDEADQLCSQVELKAEENK